MVGDRDSTTIPKQRKGALTLELAGYFATHVMARISPHGLSRQLKLAHALWQAIGS